MDILNKNLKYKIKTYEKLINSVMVKPNLIKLKV
jgi:hypothetical protein